MNATVRSGTQRKPIAFSIRRLFFADQSQAPATHSTCAHCVDSGPARPDDEGDLGLQEPEIDHDSVAT